MQLGIMHYIKLQLFTGFFSHALLTDIISAFAGTHFYKLSNIIKGENISGLMYVCFMAASEEGKSEQLHHMSGSLEEGVGE